MFEHITWTETGFLAGLGLLLGWTLKCCGIIEQSRCTSIKIGCIKIERKPLSEDAMLELRQMSSEPPQDNPPEP